MASVMASVMACSGFSAHFTSSLPEVQASWKSRSSSLPRKIVITDLEDAERPQYRARLYWDTTTPVDAGVFAFQPPAGSTRIELVPREAVASVSETEN